MCQLYSTLQGITNSFTLEASYGGSNKGHKAYTHFNVRDYQQLGRYWCETLVDCCDPRFGQHIRFCTAQTKPKLGLALLSTTYYIN